MKAYIICIIVTLLLNFFAEKFFKKNHKFLGLLFMGISLFTLCFIAGVRNLTVGTDVNVYVSRLIHVSNNSIDIFNYLKNSNSDLLFALLIYLGNLSKSAHFVLFLIELAVALPIYIYAYKTKEKNSLSITILIFFLTMYCVSFNLMRQSIAIAICILAYYYFNNRQSNKAYILLIVAALFHKTALIFVVTFFINWMIKSRIKYKVFLIFLTIVCLVFAGLFMDKIVMLTSYSKYLNMSNFMRNFSWGSILKIIFWIGLGILSYNKIVDKEHKLDTIIAILFASISLVLTITSFKIPGTGRLGYYFIDLFYFLIIFEIPKSFKQRKIILFIVVSILAILWWKMTAVENDISKVNPYKSDIINFLN